MQEFFVKHTDGVRLVGLVFVTLYLELALIRVASAEVLYLGYFSNYILIAVFLGIGLGFLGRRLETRLFDHLPAALLFIMAFILVTRIDVTPIRDSIGQLYWGNTLSESPLPLWVCLPVIFGSTAFVFACIGQETSRCFGSYKPLVAYSLDIAGSLLGIVVFTLHSWSGGTPGWWFLVVTIAIVALSFPRRRAMVKAGAIGLGLCLIVVGGEETGYVEWSPYQKIEVKKWRSGYWLNANGVGHQTMEKIGEKEPIYDFPYTTVRKRLGKERYDNVLIIGAGSGTDVAYALHYDVGQVDAVEIDPEIQAAGMALHPEKPYADPRVTRWVDDGRAFMERADKKYDLIVYALPDSLALVSSFSSIRLESFLFTVESFTQARDLLKDDGVLVLYNAYRERWLVDKMAAMLERVFGHPPVLVQHSDKPLVICSLAIGPTLAGDPLAVEVPDDELATDDWPFLYMQNRHIPPMYVAIMVLFIAAAAIGCWIVGGRKTLGSWKHHTPFFFMGAAFLLLETKSVIQFSLLFGATWLVNSLVFAAVLTSVLLANMLVSKFPRAFQRPRLLFAALFITLVVAWLLPLSSLLAIDVAALRYLLASVVLFAPIFIANLLFGALFADTAHASTSFGWNIIGAMVGGALEYTSLVLGYDNITIVVALLYGAAAAGAFLMLRADKPTTAPT